MKRNIRISYFSCSGLYCGSISSLLADNSEKIRKQIDFENNQLLCLEFGKKIIEAKINNQFVIARRLVNKRNIDVNDILYKLRLCRKKCKQVRSIKILLGIEGLAARLYFQILRMVFANESVFKIRIARPASDPVNALLNLGYSFLLKEIHGEIENHGMSAYVGFLHVEKYNHPALASDLIEEWRPVIVDTVVIKMMKLRGIVDTDYSIINGRCVLSKDIVKMFIRLLEERLNEKHKFLVYYEKTLSFRESIWHQVNRYSSVLSTGNVDLYKPLRIR